MQAFWDFINNLIKILAALFGKKPGPTPPTPPTPPNPPAPPLPFEYSADEAQLLVAHNTERRKSGVPELYMNMALTKAARGQAKYMADTKRLSHIGPNANTVTTRIKNEGYKPSAVGENIAENFKTIDNVMTAFMNSNPHRRNLLNAGYRDMGAGIYTSDKGVIYYCIDLGVQGGGISTEHSSGGLLC